MATALDGLNVLTRSLGEQDPAIALAQLNKKRLDEMKRNLYMQGIGGPERFTTGATPADVQSTEEDLKNSPYGDEAAARRSQVDEQVATANRPDVQELTAKELAAKLAIAAAPNEAQAQGALAVEKQKQVGEAAQEQRVNDRIKQFMGIGGGQEGQPNPNVKMDLNAKGEPVLSQIPISTQTRQMGETSNDILDVLDRSDYINQAQRLHDQGLFAPGIGIIRRAAAHNGLGTLFGMGPQVANDLGQFETTHDLLISAIARAHGGARAAGNIQLAQRFDKMLADQGDIPTFLGELKGVRGLLEQYASHTNPQRGFSSTAPTSGVTPGNAENDPAGILPYLRSR